jgi:hypothetical protein
MMWLPMSRENIQFETAVLVSLALHVAFLGGWEQRARLARVPVVGAIVKALTPAPKPVIAAQAKTEAPVEPVITFVEEKDLRPVVLAPATPARPKQFIETDNSQVTGEKPKQTDFYSDRSTVAANPMNPTTKTSETPFLDGNDTRMLSTENVAPKLAPSRPQPVTPSPQVAMLAPAKPATAAPLLKPVDLPQRKPEEARDEVKSPGENKGAKEGTEKKGALEKPKPVPEEGLKSQPETKLAMLTPPPVPKTVPMPKPEPPQTETPPAKPELSLQQPPPAPPSPPPSPPGGTGSAGSVSEREIAARKTKLNTTGVTRLGIAAFNVEESPFGAYDKQIVRAVQSRWYALIEKNGLYERAGEVTIHFQLLADGTVTNAEVKSTSAGEILALFCQKAIVESAPFAPWPEQLRAYLGNEPRDVDFTFYY